MLLLNFKLKKVMFEKNFFFEEKTNSLISLSGEDKFSFLQGIISNDIETLKKKTSIYSAILSPQGKYFSDFFISLYNDNILIEINNDNLTEFIRKLTLYKLKSNVKIEVLENFQILLANQNFEGNLNNIKDKIAFFDPRFNKLFKRIYLFGAKNKLYEKNITRISDDEYKTLRLANHVPDFTVDSIQNKSLLMEMRFDELNGISWEKGCYIGQEITARMFYRKITKKKLTHIKIIFKNNINEKIFLDEQEVGFITSHNKINGFGFVNSKFEKFFDNKIFSSKESELILSKPLWSKKD